MLNVSRMNASRVPLFPAIGANSRGVGPALAVTDSHAVRDEIICFDDDRETQTQCLDSDAAGSIAPAVGLTTPPPRKSLSRVEWTPHGGGDLP